MNVYTMLPPVAKEMPDAIAIINKQGREISYHNFIERVDRVTSTLAKYNIQKGSKVLILCPVDIELYILMAAIYRLGGIVVFIDPWASKEYINAALEKVNCDCLIYTKLAKLLIWKIKNIAAISSRYEDKKIFEEAREEKPYTGHIEVDKEDTALITFTTGSSNNPKGFDRSHGFLLAQHFAHEEYFKHESGDVDMCMFPVFVTSNIISGVTSVLANVDLRNIKSVNPKSLLDQFNNHSVNSLTCSPALVEPLIKYCQKNQIELPQVKKFFTGGAPVNPLLFEDLKSIFINAKMTLLYGSTESEPIALIDSDEVLEKTKTKTLQGKGVALGRVVPKLQYRLIPIVDGPVAKIEEVQSGDIGEIILTGEFVGKKYYKNEEAFLLNKIVDEKGEIWHRTGDLAYEDNDGCLFMMGRLHSRIEERSNSTFPLEIEPVLDQVAGVRRSAYFQYSKEEKLSAVLIEGTADSNNDNIVENIQKICDEKSLKPEKVFFTSDMPLDPRHRAKIDYNSIKKRFSKIVVEKMENANYLKKLYWYTKERFPLPPTFLATVILFFAAAFAYQRSTIGEVTTLFNGSMIVSLFTLLGVFFHLRLLDEFKDYEEDCKAYPERLLSRGIITLTNLKYTVITVLFLELIFNGYIGGNQFLAWAVVTIYSLLMFKEFFIAEKLKQVMWAYLLSHQVIVPLMILYAFSTQGDFPVMNKASWCAVFILALSSFIYEVARKTWSSDREHELADSYTSSWGIPYTTNVLFSLFTIKLILWIGFITYNGMGQYSLALPGLIYLASIFLVSKFRQDPTNKNSKLVELSGVLHMVLGNLSVMLISYFL